MSEHLNKPPEVETSEEVINIVEITNEKAGRLPWIHIRQMNINHLHPHKCEHSCVV